MTDLSLYLFIYKMASLLAGITFGILGYKLFCKGVFHSAGDMDARFKNSKLILKQAAPGTFFALFGAAIILVSLLKGLNFSDSYKKTEENVAGQPIAAEQKKGKKVKAPENKTQDQTRESYETLEGGNGSGGSNGSIQESGQNASGMGASPR